MTDLENEKRKNRRLAALGTNEPKCPCCGETDWRVFEQDHIAGRARDDMVVNICANCHRKRTYDQKGHPLHNPQNDPNNLALSLGIDLSTLPKNLANQGNPITTISLHAHAKNIKSLGWPCTHVG